MLTRILSFFSSLDGLSLLLTVVVGVGCLAFVSVTWVLHLVATGRLILAATVARVSVLLSLAAMARIPIAVLLLCASAVVVAVAMTSGASGLVLP